MKNRNFRTLKGLRQRQAGYTLVELSISISIIALLIVGSITGVQSLLLANKANRTLSQTTVATANISRLAAATNSTSFKTIELIKLGAWDVSAIKGSGDAATAQNPFGGAIQVAQNSGTVGTYGARSGYFYYITGVPESQCASLATSFYSTAPGIYINAFNTATDKLGGSPTYAPDKGTHYRFPGQTDNLGNLTWACSSGNGTNGLVEIALFIPA
jgi:prepilin-type N-terminal cleavage/methylation domain-containing protein